MRNAVILGAAILLAWPALAQQGAPDAEPDPVLVIGQIYWPGKDLTNAQIRVFRDQQRQDPVGAFPSLDNTGRCLLPLRPGEYWLMAVVDLNGDQKLGPGDGLGFYGVVDPTQSQPQPFKVEEKTFAALLPISLEMGQDNKLVATGVQEPPPPGPTRWVTLAGHVSGQADQGPVLVYLVPQGGGLCFAALATAPTGQFTATVAAGRYYVFAVQDSNDDARVSLGDRVAVYGYSPEQGAAFPTAEFKDNQAELALTLGFGIGEGGQLKALAGDGLGPKMDLGTLPALIRGHVRNMPDAEGRGMVRAFRDATLREEVGLARCYGGDFALCLPEGLYFLSVFADRDGNDKPTPGDWVGFFGVDDLLKSRGPQPLMVRTGEIRTLDLGLTAVLDAASHPAPLPATPQ